MWVGPDFLPDPSRHTHWVPTLLTLYPGMGMPRFISALGRDIYQQPWAADQMGLSKDPSQTIPPFFPEKSGEWASLDVEFLVSTADSQRLAFSKQDTCEVGPMGLQCSLSLGDWQRGHRGRDSANSDTAPHCPRVINDFWEGGDARKGTNENRVNLLLKKPGSLNLIETLCPGSLVYQ